MKNPFRRNDELPASSKLKAAHMTFVRSHMGRTLSRTSVVLRRQLWIWPILAFLMLSTVGYFVQSSIQATMRDGLKTELQTLLTVETAMLENWYTVQRSHAQTVANSPVVRGHVSKLLSEQTKGQPLTEEEARTIRFGLRRDISPLMDVHQLEGFMIVDRNRMVVASSRDETSEGQEIEQFDSFLTRVLEGEVVVTTPVAGSSLHRDVDGILRAGTPTMFAMAPVLGEDLQVLGAIALRIQPEKEFTRILQLGRLGKSGETYAFNKNGLLVSNSRFDEDLILLGLIPDLPQSKSILKLLLRNPGMDMTRGFRPTRRRSEMPMTKMALSAVSGQSGIDVSGYSDYRGVQVVGSWTWLKPYEIGVATEIDYEEAYRPLTILSRAFIVLYSLLIFTSGAIFVFTLVLGRMRREAQKAAIEAQELGQYKLETQLGAGAMGVVYKGYHAMMRRPTAIKLLNVEIMTESAIERFEHEVQITCQLNHPNTIAIYDYGRTPEGVFYYAMEYLDGINLQTLVEDYGPQPESRIIQILLQICGSLYEAHSQGLVHRDIKPANIMLNRRGGEPDVVKVLDFGLVKQVDPTKKSQEGDNGLAGTPLYLSPEAIQSPTLIDACSDLYAVGAVGYFLITGKTVFDASSVMELLQMHVSEPPIPPSQRTNNAVSKELEDTILSCLEKSRAKRPQTARDLAFLLRRCQPEVAWSLQDADSWWGNHERRQRGISAVGSVLANSVVQVTSSTSLHSDDSPPKGPESVDLDATIWNGSNTTGQDS